MTTSMRVAVGHGAVDAGSVADSLADGLAEQGGHAGGGGAGGEAPGFEHGDAPVAAPGCFEQGERHERGLTGPGWGDEHGIAAGQGVEQGGQGVVDREVGGGGGERHGFSIAPGRGRTI